MGHSQTSNFDQTNTLSRFGTIQPGFSGGTLGKSKENTDTLGFDDDFDGFGGLDEFVSKNSMKPDGEEEKSEGINADLKKKKKLDPKYLTSVQNLKHPSHLQWIIIMGIYL